jgi:hypothetical protein
LRKFCFRSLISMITVPFCRFRIVVRGVGVERWGVECSTTRDGRKLKSKGVGGVVERRGGKVENKLEGVT